VSHLDILFVSPHPDDVEIFCGGTVARCVALGHRVGILDLTRGELASNGTPEGRRAESLEAAARLGVTTERQVLGLPDGGLDDRDDAQVDAVVEVLRSTRARVLVAPPPVDRHPDHEAAHRLVRRAHFLGGLARRGSGEPFRAARVVHYLGHVDRVPSFVVDVSAYMDARRAAIAAYASQFERSQDDRATPINQPGFRPALEGRMANLGRQIGVDFAEPFGVEGPVPVADPVRTWTGGSE